MKKKLVIGILGLIFFISLMFFIFLLFSDKIHYDVLSRVEPENLSDIDYVKLESGEKIKQVIRLTDDAGYLKNIDIIMINLSEETSNDILNIKIYKNGKTLKEIKYSIAQAEPGEWTSIPIGKTLSLECEYEIEFSIQENSGADIPYLVIQEVDEASPNHRQLLLNDEELDMSVAISYDFYEIVPVGVKVIISILCLIIVGEIIYYIFKRKKLGENWNKAEINTFGKTRKVKRNVNCDLMRVVCMVFVIAIHADPDRSSFIKSTFLNVVLSTLLYTCNGSFYMLSGRFNLEKDFSSKENYKKYFYNKIITILLPYLLVTCVLCLWNIVCIGSWNGIVSYMQETYISFMTNSSGHLWFMYPLIGMLLGAPFMAKMLRNMSDWELNLLFGIGIVWNIVSIYLTLDFGVGFSYSGWMLSGWIMLFFLGYYCSRIINNVNKKYFYLFGVIGFAITVFGKYFIPDRYFNSFDLAVAYIVFTMAFYLFWDREIVIKNEDVKKVISFVAKYSFIIYMLHCNVLYTITSKIVTESASVYNWIISIFITLAISMLLSVVLDLFFISPIQKTLRKVLHY